MKIEMVRTHKRGTKIASGYSSNFNKSVEVPIEIVMEHLKLLDDELKRVIVRAIPKMKIEMVRTQKRGSKIASGYSSNYDQTVYSLRNIKLGELK